VRITAAAQGVEVHFPPLRAPAAAFGLAVFGATCVLLPLLAAGGLVPAGASETYGLLAIVLIGAFIAPFPVFGAVFIALAVYMLANSLTVRADAAGIFTVRRLFGVAIRRRALARTELAGIETGPAARYQGLLSAEPCFRLVARHTSQRARDVVLADSVRGERAAGELRALIARHAGLAVQ
jgi:hypothetical protein